MSILKLKNGVELSVLTLQGRLNEISATFDNFESAVSFYRSLVKENLSVVTLTTNEEIKTYNDRQFGSFLIETSPEEEKTKVRFSLVPPPAKSPIDNSEELYALRSENSRLIEENAALSEKAMGYDIITKGV